jgi:hypothetical protein
MKKVYAEIGFGNDTFLNTEIENEDGSEYRVPKFIKPQKIIGYYFFLLIHLLNLILSLVLLA